MYKTEAMESNIALIATLYNSPGADLYKDIYFPLIKYSIMCIYNDYGDTERHYDITALQEKILEKSGITIPLQVLRASVRLLSRRSEDSGVYLYKGDNYFKITPAISDEIATVDKGADQISTQYRRLELYFKEYLETEKLTSLKSLKDFFQDTSIEVFRYIDNVDALSVVDQSYVNVVRFIDWVKSEKPDSYQVIENLLWGSIIAGFLRRTNADIGVKTIEKIDYYLDSSLVLSLLGLNSAENIAYAKDLVRIITESGATIKVHAITLREIRRILEQVELSQVPKRGSSIEQAWIEQEMSLSDILHIRNQLGVLLRRANVDITNVSESELDNIELKYKVNCDVKLLAEKRGYINGDFIREIHDIYMRDYINRLNHEGTLIEKQGAYFVSLNSDLVKFSHQGQGKAMSVIHAAKVVMNLWLHSANSILVKKTALEEVMSRCYALNQTDVRIKLRCFYKYYRNCSLTKDDIAGMYSSLLRRSAHTINSVEELEKNEDSENDNKAEISIEIINGLKEAVANEKKEREASLKSTQERVQELAKRTEFLEKTLETGEKELYRKDALIQQYAEKRSFDQTTIVRLEKELNTISELRSIDLNLNDLNLKKRKMNEEREKSVTYLRFWLILIFEIISIILLFGCVVMLIINWSESELKKIFSFGFAITLISLISRLNNMYICSPYVMKMKLRDEQYIFWESNHVEYSEVLSKIRELEGRKRQLECV